MPAAKLFLDTNGWIALLNADDPMHEVADRRWREVGRGARSVFLTDWIVAETGNGLARTLRRREFVQSARTFRDSAIFHCISVSPSLLARALKLYDERPDKTWGLVDCASFIVMRDEEIADAFTTDGHFEQAGFRCLLPVPQPR